ncbi:molybdopterin-guanine dinucleotide biosynthesis protein B [Evansella vedderi]|uniref:Molybdopterin-guanine dinucleotide biosynthesis protein B n=1 Tax=Evansella vedderi TaxID=38282 RepID=A0ABT9ZZC3_9BACI|nr:molybdopterin-guanine dinucleotide biosynthesis protein B [Evansella vedderi]MDQ0255445.1 molybdopterin-guanine dinucleotide biosynthesis protein B [Evansella vedderi]
MRKRLIFQIVGYSNSGKTTLISKWIERLSKNGYKAVTIKHHGHGHSLTSLDEGKDTSYHRKAGAIGSLVTSDGELQLTMKLEEPLKLKEVLSFYNSFDLDVVIVEGYKKEALPKLVLLRREEDISLLDECSLVEAVICWEEEEKEKLSAMLMVPVFFIGEEEKYLNWLEERVEDREVL